MPTYDFTCPTHGHQEILCSISEREEQVCEVCGAALGKPDVSLGLPPVFKGTGFYCTDYREEGR